MRTGRAALAHRDGRHGLQRKSLRFDFRDNFRSRDQPGRLPANNVQVHMHSVDHDHKSSVIMAMLKSRATRMRVSAHCWLVVNAGAAMVYSDRTIDACDAKTA